MIDTAQAVLLVVVVVLTILLLVLGIQVYFILRELRQTVSKTNKVLDDTGAITQSVSGPISSFSALASGIRAGAVVARLLKGKKKNLKKRTEGEEDGK